MWTPPLRSTSLLDVDLEGPIRSTEDMRILKRRLGKDGVVYCKLVVGTAVDVSSLIGRPKSIQFRTTEAGLALKIMALTRVDPQNALEQEIQARVGQAFLTREEDGRSELPTAQYNHIVSRPLTADAPDVSRLSENCRVFISIGLVVTLRPL